MPSIGLAITLFCLSLLLALPATADPLGKRVDQAMRDELASQDLVGLAVGVIQDGEITHLNG